MFSRALLLDKGNEIPVIYRPLMPALLSLPSPQGNTVMTLLKSIHGNLLSPCPTADSDLALRMGMQMKNTCFFLWSLWPDTVHPDVFLAVMLRQQSTQ